MAKHAVVEIIIIIVLFAFSSWLMSKSFGYDTGASQFRIARHEEGDFGLHISLIRSFSWGENGRTIQSPFYPGRPLAYHYFMDWITGQLVRLGIRIDYAYNVISALAFTILLYGLYRLTIFLSNGNRMAGLVSIILFILPSNLSFIDIVKGAPKDISFFSYFWRFPDYLHKGPFDGSTITIYNTLAPYLNQRHLIAGMAIGIMVIFFVIQLLNKKTFISISKWLLIGGVVGLSTRIHVLIAGATAVLVVILLIGKNMKAALYFVMTAIFIALPYIVQIFSMRSETGVMQSWNPGYLSPRPLSFLSFVYFWIYNLGILVILVPLVYRATRGVNRRLIVGAGTLFLIANTLQLSYRMEHNHSLINYAVTILLPFISIILVAWWQKKNIAWKSLSAFFLVLLTLSGVFNLMVVKNDYQLMVDDAPKNKFMEWIRTETDPKSVFIGEPALYDPVTLAGRKNYLGHDYYVSVMGYDYLGRRNQISSWFEDFNEESIIKMRGQSIRYLAIPTKSKEFFYGVDEDKVRTLLPVVYYEESMNVYEL